MLWRNDSIFTFGFLSVELTVFHNKYWKVVTDKTDTQPERTQDEPDSIHTSRRNESNNKSLVVLDKDH